MDTTEKIIAELRDRNYTDIDLDELVHEVCANIAAGVNNGGLESQVKFLLDEGYDPLSLVE